MNPRVGRGVVGTVTREDVQDAQNAEDAVEAILAGCVRAEPVDHCLEHDVVRFGRQSLHRREQWSGNGGPV